MLVLSTINQSTISIHYLFNNDYLSTLKFYLSLSLIDIEFLVVILVEYTHFNDDPFIHIAEQFLHDIPFSSWDKLIFLMGSSKKNSLTNTIDLASITLFMADILISETHPFFDSTFLNFDRMFLFLC